MAKTTLTLVQFDPANDAHVTAIQRLHMRLFPGCNMPYFAEARSRYFLVFSQATPVAFGGYGPSTIERGAAYFWRVGVIPSQRGRGLQARIMEASEEHARQAGFARIVSDTTDNPPSANNFVRRGWLTYTPKKPWSFASAIYWFKTL